MPPAGEACLRSIVLVRQQLPRASGFDEDLAFSGVVGGADDAFGLHALHDRGGAVVADLEAALDIGGRGLLVAQDDGDGLLVGVVTFRRSQMATSIAGRVA